MCVWDPRGLDRSDVRSLQKGGGSSSTCPVSTRRPGPPLYSPNGATSTSPTFSGPQTPTCPMVILTPVTTPSPAYPFPGRLPYVSPVKQNSRSSVVGCNSSSLTRSHERNPCPDRSPTFSPSAHLPPPKLVPRLCLYPSSSDVVTGLRLSSSPLPFV